MKKLASRIAVATAAASMAFAPIAAQANTRAGDSSTVYTSASAPGVSAAVEGEDFGATRGLSGILIILFGAAAAAGLIILLDDDDNQSPGA